MQKSWFYSTNSLIKFISILLSVSLLACQSVPKLTSSNSSEHTVFIDCPDLRPTFCTSIYQPVCAKKDTGVRCFTTPCPSEAWQTIENACTACTHQTVYGYVEGACSTTLAEP